MLLNPQALRSRMLGKWREQKDFDARAKDGAVDQAPKELHELAYVSAAKGGCDCTAACTKVSTTSAAGQCCSCGGVNEVFAKATFNADTYLCQ